MSGILGDIYSGLFGNGGSDSYNQALEALKNVSLPELQRINPELYKAVTQITPEMEQNVVLGTSATDGISLDPRYKQAQMQALSKLMDITSNSGQDAQSKADNARLQNDINTNLQGNTAAIQQNMATRGLSGGLSELVSKQMATQQAANRQAQMGMDINAQAQQRALQALMNQSNVANQMSTTDFNQQNTKAQAQDAISRFNAQNLQNVNSANTQAKNQAQQSNATNAQNIANKNTDLTNKAYEWNTNGIAQQNFDNAMSKASGVSKQYNNVGISQDKARDENSQLWGNLISSGAKAYAGGA